MNNLHVAAELAKRELPAFADFALKLGGELARRWPDSAPLALYPAFRAAAA